MKLTILDKDNLLPQVYGLSICMDNTPDQYTEQDYKDIQLFINQVEQSKNGDTIHTNAECVVDNADLFNIDGETREYVEVIS